MTVYNEAGAAKTSRAAYLGLRALTGQRPRRRSEPHRGVPDAPARLGEPKALCGAEGLDVERDGLRRVAHAQVGEGFMDGGRHADLLDRISRFESERAAYGLSPHRNTPAPRTTQASTGALLAYNPDRRLPLRAAHRIRFPMHRSRAACIQPMHALAADDRRTAP